MGAVRTSGGEFWGIFSDLVGYKLGLAPNEIEMLNAITSADLVEDWPIQEDFSYRIRSEVIEEICRALLRAFGDPDADAPDLPVYAVQQKYEHVPGWEPVLQFLVDNLAMAFSEDGRTGVERYMRAAAERFGQIGLDMSLDLIQFITAKQNISPWSRMRRVEWENVLQLEDLFESENVAATYGLFFDQRFIDFLHRNFERIDEIHWRNFEKLTAEYLDREGYEVELGPGRNDGGIDVRVWPQDGNVQGPPLLVVQCKRTASAVDVTTLKAFHADIVHAQAAEGLIVTTSHISSAGQRLNTARGYEIAEANRQTIRLWLDELRSPGSGIFFAR
jgi:restriction system protein